MALATDTKLKLANWLDCTKTKATLDTYMYWPALNYTARFTSRCDLCDHHGGFTFCIWFLALSSLVREKVSKLTIFLT